MGPSAHPLTVPYVIPRLVVNQPVCRGTLFCSQNANFALIDIESLLRGTGGKAFAIKRVPVGIVQLGLTVDEAADT